MTEAYIKLAILSVEHGPTPKLHTLLAKDQELVNDIVWDNRTLEEQVKELVQEATGASSEWATPRLLSVDSVCYNDPFQDPYLSITLYYGQFIPFGMIQKKENYYLHSVADLTAEPNCPKETLTAISLLRREMI